MAIDPHTFGGTHAGEILAHRLNEIGNKRLTRRVSSFLHHTFKGFSELRAVEDDFIFKELVVLWRKDRMEKIKFGYGLDTFIGSIITGVSRDWLRGVDE